MYLVSSYKLARVAIIKVKNFRSHGILLCQSFVFCHAQTSLICIPQSKIMIGYIWTWPWWKRYWWISFSFFFIFHFWNHFATLNNTVALFLWALSLSLHLFIPSFWLCPSLFLPLSLPPSLPSSISIFLFLSIFKKNLPLSPSIFFSPFPSLSLSSSLIFARVDVHLYNSLCLCFHL